MGDKSKALFGLLISIVESKQRGKWNFSFWEERYLSLCNAVLRCSLDNDTKECIKCKKNFEPKVHKILKLGALYEDEGLLKKETLIELVQKTKAIGEEACVYTTLQELDRLLIEITNFQVLFRAWNYTLKKKRFYKKKRGAPLFLVSTREDLQMEKLIVNQYKITTNQVRNLLKKIKKLYDASVSQTLQKANRRAVTKLQRRLSLSEPVSIFTIIGVMSLGLLMTGTCPVQAEPISFKDANLESLHETNFFTEVSYDASTEPTKISWPENQYIRAESAAGFGATSRLLTGKGTYYKDEKEVYIGHFEDNLPHGKGKSYDEDRRLLYDGEWVEGVPHGKGTMYKDGKIWYEGFLVNGKPEGEQGTEYFSDGKKKRYTGSWKQGEWHGGGVLYFKSHEDINTYLDGAYTMYTEIPQPYKYDDDDTLGSTFYKGNFEMGFFQGQGTLQISIVKSGLINTYKQMTYTGNWEKGKMKGQGIWTSLAERKWEKNDQGTLNVYFKYIQRTIRSDTILVEFEIQKNGSGIRNKLSKDRQSTWKYQQGVWTSKFIENGPFKIFAENGQEVAKGTMTNGVRTGSWNLFSTDYSKWYTVLYKDGNMVQVNDMPVSKTQLYSGGYDGQNRKLFGKEITLNDQGGTVTSKLLFFDDGGNIARNVYWTLPEYKRVNVLEKGKRYRKYDTKENKWATIIIDNNGKQEDAQVSRPLPGLIPAEGQPDKSELSFFKQNISLSDGYTWSGLVDDEGYPGIEGTLFQNGSKIYEGQVGFGKEKVVKQGEGKQFEVDTTTGDMYISFYGQYLNDQREGPGQVFDSTGTLRYEGQFKENKKHGKGKEYVKGLLVFEGNFVEGKRDGKFEEYDSTSSKKIASGTMRNGQMHGHGYIYQKQLGWIEATWGNGEIDTTKEYWIFPGSIDNYLLPHALQGQLTGNSEDGYSLVTGSAYLTCRIRSLPNTYSWKGRWYEDIHKRPQEDGALGFMSSSVRPQSVAYELVFDRTQNLPHGYGYIYDGQSFYPFWKDKRSIPETKALRLMNNILPFLTGAALLIQYNIFGFLYDLNEKPLPALKSPYFATYLERLKGGEKIPSYYINYLL